MECKFKFGDLVERIGYDNCDAMPVPWKGRVTGVSDDGEWLWFGCGLDGLAENFKLVEEEVTMPEIAVGSKWAFVEDKSAIVSVVHVNNNGTIVLKVEQRGNSYHEEEENGLYDTGNIFVFGEDEETLPFTDCYTPYIESKTIVRYVMILKKKDSGEFVSSGFNYDTEQEAKSIYDRCFSDTFDLIKIIEVKYTEGEE